MKLSFRTLSVTFLFSLGNLKHKRDWTVHLSMPLSTGSATYLSTEVEANPMHATASVLCFLDSSTSFQLNYIIK